MSELYEEARKDLDDYASNEQMMTLTMTELFDLWEVATRSCRKEIKRLERLLDFQMRGRTADADERNGLIACQQRELADSRGRVAAMRKLLEVVYEWCVTDNATGIEADIDADAIKAVLDGPLSDVWTREQLQPLLKALHFARSMADTGKNERCYTIENALSHARVIGLLKEEIKP